MGGEDSDEWLTKKCARCGSTKLRLDFYRDRRRPDGLKGHCKECELAARRARRVVPDTKLCNPCGRDLAATEFYPSSSTSDGLQHMCRECSSTLQKERNRQAAYKEARRASALRSRYDISVTEYERLFRLQDKRCAICRNRPQTRRLAVDHNHRTGAVRGLLCDWCNRKVLGGARDKPAILRAAAEYLECPPTQRLAWRDTA